MTAQLVNFPQDNNVSDIPGMLRTIADCIDTGSFGDAHNLAWVIDCGSGKVETGLMGQAAEAGVTAHFLLHLGMLKIANGAIEISSGDVD